MESLCDLYVFQTNFDHMMNHLWYNHLKILRPWFDLLMSSKVKGHEVNWKIIYDFVYVLHINIGHSILYIGLNR